MIIRGMLVLAAATLAACGAPKSKSADASQDAASGQAAADAEPEKAVSAERELVDRNAGHPELTPQQKVGGAEGRSPFVGDRVVKLNAIVRRSLEISHEFDTVAAGVRAAVATAASGGDRAAAEAGVKTVSDLHDRAKLALDDMSAAEADLKASGEYYDDAILYGMTKFVADIEAELREEKAALQARLGG